MACTAVPCAADRRYRAVRWLRERVVAPCGGASLRMKATAAGPDEPSKLDFVETLAPKGPIVWVDRANGLHRIASLCLADGPLDSSGIALRFLRFRHWLR